MEQTEFTKKLENQTVNETDTVILECQLSKPHQTVQWRHNDKPVVQDGRITVNVAAHKHQLTIQHVTPEDAGYFSCVYGNVSTGFTLRVEEIALAFTETLTDQTVLEAVDVSLSCRLSKPYQRVKWLTNSYLVPPYDRVTLIAGKFIHRLIIRDVTPEASGEYRCVCDNVRTHCTLKVASEELAPGFTKTLENNTAMEAETVTLECQLSKPYQTVNWMKNEESVVPDGRVTVIVEAHKHKFVIRNVTLEDAGNFSCVYHSARTECTLQVEELEPEFTRTLENQTVYSTITVSQECRLSKPNKTVQWVKNGQQMRLDDRISATVAIYTHRLIIKDVKMEDAGTYRCVYGNVNTQSTLTVEELPEENDWFDGKIYCNWVKTSVSLCYLKEGITEFTNTKATCFHKDIKERVSLRKSKASSTTCNQCTHKHARKIKGKDKNTTTWRMNCSMNICNVWLEEILPYHRHVAICPNIEWKNSDPRLWPSDGWEIAKLFQPFGCKDQHKAEDCDATGLLTLLLDCSFFSKFMSNLQLLQKIKDVRNVCMHSKDLIMKVVDMEQSLNLMVTFLGETELQKYQTARESAAKITQLRDSRLDLSLKTCFEGKVLKDKLTEVKHNIKRLDDTDNNLRGGTDSMSAQRNTYLGDYRQRLKEFQDLFSEVETALRNIIQETDHDIEKTFTQFIPLINRLQDIEQDNRELEEYYQPRMSTLDSELRYLTSESQEQTKQPDENQLRAAAPAPCFSKELRSQAVFEKATVTLECKLSQPNQTVRWLKGVTQVCSSDHITVEADTYTHRLIIKDVTLADAGTFWCFCDNVGSTCTLDVNELAPEFINKLENHTVIEAVTVTLSCQLSKPNKKVQWLRNGNPVLPDERITVTADEYIQRLIITDIRLEDCGNFRCICGKESTQCTLTVNEAVPYFLKKLVNQTKTETDTVMLMCLLSKPNQKVMWTRYEVPIIPDDHIAVTADEYTHVLTISDVTLEDAGNFRCVCGNVSSECKLTVEELPVQFVKQLENTQGYIRSSTRTTLSCELDRPNKNVTWTKDDQAVSGNDNLKIVSGIYTHQLVFSNLTNSVTGKYTCTYGGDSTTATLTIDARPPQEERHVDQDGQAMSGNDNLNIVSGVYTHQLVFFNLTHSVAGKYTCTYGGESTAATLTVYDNDEQASRELEFAGDKAKDIRKKVRKKRSSVQKLTLLRVNLSSLGDQLSDVLTLQHLVRLTLISIKLSHEQCENLGRDLRGSPQLRELTLQDISCTTHGEKSGCGELDLGGPLRLHGITLQWLPFTRVVFNPELLLRCVINLLDNVAGQVSSLQNLLAARNLQTFTCWNVRDAVAISKLVDVLPQLHSLQQLRLYNIDFGSVTDIRLSATMDQLKKLEIKYCKFDTAGLECLLQQHNLPKRRVKITLRHVTIRGEEDVINKIRQSLDTDVTEDSDVECIEGEWKVVWFTFYTRK